MSRVVRWKFEDTETGETIVLPINPNEATPVEPARNMRWAWGNYWGVDRIRGVNNGQANPVEWTFGGVIYTQEHHDLLLFWARRSSVLRVSDHLGRTFEILTSRFEFTDRRPTPLKPWKGTYQMTCLILKDVTE